MKKLFIILLLSVILCQQAQAIIVEQIGLYKQYPIDPNAKETIVNPPGSQVVKIDRKNGYYVDGRNQVDPNQQIAPPHPEKIPQEPRATRTVEPFESYYDRNKMGMRRHPYMAPVVPGHNIHYSERRARPYTKQEYMDVWCAGKQYVMGADCVTENYAIYFYAVRNWPAAVIRAPWRAKKTGKQAAIFFYVDDLGLDAPQMHDAKEWAEMFNMKIFFGTISEYIPLDWVI